MSAPRDIFSYRKFWAERFGVAPELPTSTQEMEALGWDSCDIVIVTGDAYVDHPSFGMAVIGRVLEAQGFRVGIIAQPDWTRADDFARLGRPNLFFGVTGGNMDSMVNRYTADRRPRSNDAYTPDGEGGKRPDRSVVVYAQRCREAFKDVPIVIGGIEASLRRIAHYDYWSDRVRRSVLVDAKADLLVYGNAERQVVALAHRLAAREPIESITDLRGTVFIRRAGERADGCVEVDSTDVEQPGRVDAHADPYAERAGATLVPGAAGGAAVAGEAVPAAKPLRNSGQVLVKLTPSLRRKLDPGKTVIRLPAFEAARDDPVLYAHASRVLHLETNPGNARALVQAHGNRDVWINPPPIPLTTRELDRVFELPYTRVPHSRYGGANIPAYEMIRFSVNIMRGCFGGCTFCSITEHEGRIIQSRSQDSILREIEQIRDLTPGFTGVISDLGGPTANMYRLACKSEAIERVCRRPSCVYPGICSNLDTDHAPLIDLYRKARELPGIKKVLIASGLRYDLAIRSTAYVRELVTHHVGGYLKIAPEHTESGPLEKMMKPGMGAYDRFKQLFERFSKEAGKEQYLIPYFIAAHPGTSDEDMMNLALWLKGNGFRADQVQTFLPSPMASATAMYHSGTNPLSRVRRNGEKMTVVRNMRQRRLHKAFLRYHDPDNWPMLRAALKRMGRADLIGNGKRHLIPNYQPTGTGRGAMGSGRHPKGKRFLTQQTGLAPLAEVHPARAAEASPRTGAGKRRGGDPPVAPRAAERKAGAGAPGTKLAKTRGAKFAKKRSDGQRRRPTR